MKEPFKIIILIATIFPYSLPAGATPANGRDTLTTAVDVPHAPIRHHSPRKATFMAMALPGLGQLYNDHWWKLPILYGGVGAALYGFTWNHRTYVMYRDAFVAYTRYMNEKAENPEIPYPRPNEWDKVFKPGGSAENYPSPQRFQEILKTKKNYYKRDRDLLIIVMGGIYIIQILDASVFAHFYEYEISEDLSMHVLPSVGIDPRAGIGRAGISLTLRF